MRLVYSLSLVALSLSTSTAAADRLVRHAVHAVPGEYIVVFDQAVAGLAPADIDRAIDGLAARHGAIVEHRYGAALRGFAARMSAAQAEALARDPAVAFVEENTRVYADATIQSSAAWNLDRIDQPALPLDTRYLQLADGEGATVFVLDTGVRATHQEFTGRIVQGFTSINDGRGTTDCHGHGTHVAGTVAGTVLGVAKRAKISPIRILDCNGAGTAAQTIAGLDYVMNNHPPRSIANMSLGGPANDAQDLAVRNLIASGVIVVAAAGNDNNDACLKSPARVAEALTVGNSDRTDARNAFSNYGTCVDLFAPGTDIVSASHTADNTGALLSGTSQAAPHVAGAAALYLSANPTATPAEVAAAMIAGTTPNKIGDAKGSPNRLLTTRFVDTVAPTASITSPSTGAVVPPTFRVKADVADPNLAAVQLAIDGVVLGSAQSLPVVFDVQGVPEGTHAISVIATDFAGRQTTSTVDVTVAADAPPQPVDDAPGEEVPGEAPPAESGEIVGGCSSTPAHGGFLVALAALVLARRRRCK